MNIRIKDNGYEKLLKRLTTKIPAVTVGVHAAEGDAMRPDSDITVAEIAAIHEFGLGNVDERSWLRKFVDENEAELRRMLSASAREVAAGRLTADQAMNRFGLVVAGMIKKRITAGIEPGLEDETKKRKAKLTGGAKDTPLILYSQFISSIIHELQP